MGDAALAFTPAWQLADMIRARQLSPVELVDLMLKRIERYNPILNAYLLVTADQARAEARRAEAAVMSRKVLPPLHGVPVSVKDLIQTKGIRTTAGSLAYRDFIPDSDAIVVERLHKAGAIILGKTNTPEFGQSGTTENRLGDHCRNPWNPERTAGGSSGGAGASVAAGMGPLALGSDAGGSIRHPSSFCGIYGFKPTWGRVPQLGHFGGMPLVSTVGPMTRTVRDAALLLRVIAGPDRRDPYCLRQRPPRFSRALDRGVSGMRIAWSPDLGFAAVDPEVRATTSAAAGVFQRLGVVVDEVSLNLENAFPVFIPVALADAYEAYGDLLKNHADELMPYVRVGLERGREVPAYEYARCLRAMERRRAKMADFFERYDLLLTPTTAVTAFPVGNRPRLIDGKPVDKIWGAFMFTPHFNITGQPAASIPCGFSSEGMPIGLQIIGRAGQDTTVLAASAAFEAVQPWADKLPPRFAQ